MAAHTYRATRKIPSAVLPSLFKAVPPYYPSARVTEGHCDFLKTAPLPNRAPRASAKVGWATGKKLTRSRCKAGSANARKALVASRYCSTPSMRLSVPSNAGDSFQMIKTDPTYTEHEVSRILRESEDQSVSKSDKGKGHAEQQHELQARGKNRASTTTERLQLRIVGIDVFDKSGFSPDKSGAFDGCQAAAIAFALNKKAGGTAISLLCRETCEFVEVEIDISNGSFRMIGYDIAALEPAPSGARFIAGPKGLILPGILKEIRTTAKGIWMKIMKTADKSLHIRTAYPLAVAPNPPRAKVHWRRGGILEQVLPV